MTAPTTEFEREAVPPEHLKSLRSFINMYAGEHVAGTEFMIGPLFIAAGVSAFDLLVGLLVGNLLAVLSWAFVCAPIATGLRLTLYRALEKICGTRLVILYNLANGVLFCFLAGAMISVSATAVGVPFSMPMPALGDWLPTSLGWVVMVFAIGAVFSFVAARGYDAMARVATTSVPWMFLVFLACGFVALRQLDVTSLSEFWTVAQERIWKGGDPLPGQTKFTFWHVVFFAWFCNAAMHLGMADLSILRYARRWTHGFASGAGMFVGHYLAWICASLLYAVQLARDPVNTTVAPGPMAYGAVGLSGLLCVILAGWTTANPTIYRAGLAFQAIFPSTSRFKVTLIAGTIATIGCGLSGAGHEIARLRRLLRNHPDAHGGGDRRGVLPVREARADPGLRRTNREHIQRCRRGRLARRPGRLRAAEPLRRRADLFPRSPRLVDRRSSLPPAERHGSETFFLRSGDLMKRSLFVLAGCGLILTIVPPILFFAHTIDLGLSQQLMTLGLFLWFAGDLPRVMDRRSSS